MSIRIALSESGAARADLDTELALPGDGRTTTVLADYLDHNKVINGLDYGCVADGDVDAGTGTDNTAALQTIINKSIATGRPAFLPKGVYRYSTTQLEATGGFTLIGEPGTILFKDHIHHGLYIDNPPILVNSTAVAQADNGKVQVAGAAFAVDAYAGHYCQVTTNDSGSVARLQRRKILSNTSDTLTLEYDLALTPLTGDAVVIYDILSGITIENITFQGNGAGQAGFDISFCDDVRLTNVRSIAHAGVGISINTGRNIRIDNCRGEATTFGIFVYNSDDVIVSNSAGVNVSGSFSIELKDCRNGAMIDCYAEGGSDNATTTQGLHLHTSGLDPAYNMHIIGGRALNIPNAGLGILTTLEEAAGGTPFNPSNLSVNGVVKGDGAVGSMGVEFINEQNAVPQNIRGHDLTVIGSETGFAILMPDLEVSGFSIAQCTGASITGDTVDPESDTIDRVKLMNGVVKDGNMSGTSGYECILKKCTGWTFSNVSAVHTNAASKSIGFVQERGGSDDNRYLDCRVQDTDSAYTADYFALGGVRSQVVNTARKRQSIAYAATVTPDLRLGEIVDVGTLTGNITIGAPTHPNRGLRLTLNFTQDATGGRTVTFNAAFKVNWTPDTTAGKSNSITCEYVDGYWAQVSAATGLSGTGATVISDSFTRADNAASLGLTSAGQPWVSVNGTWGISGNRAYNPSADAVDPIAAIASGLSDCTVQVTLSTVGATAGLYFRIVDQNNWLRMIANGTPGTDRTILLYKCVAGVLTAVTAVSGQTVADGDVYKVVMAGTTIQMFVNGVQVGTDQTVTEFQTATMHGIGYDVGSATGRFDDFSVTAP